MPRFGKAEAKLWSIVVNFDVAEAGPQSRIREREMLSAW
jgi:hypothetical protein